ncbi:MAG: hypothetical protein Q8Q50_02385 [Methylobacter sp.]|nr:hypothetical protein [Methylobacter sp.]
MAYSIPRDVVSLLETACNQDREKAEIFAKAIENSIQAFKNQVGAAITDKKEPLKAELYNELRTELTTKEFARAEINGVRAEISEVRAEISNVRAEINLLRGELKQTTLLLKVLIGIAVFGLTLFNPAFVKLVELIMK